jgi:outer membrane protein OmpA-like peptidoglycan-associated protein
MKIIQSLTASLLIFGTLGMLFSGCALNKTKKGAIIGAGGGAILGGVIGRASGNTALGSLIGATVGGTTGAIIGNKMDKQADEIKNTVPGAKVYRVGEGIIVEFSDKILFAFDQSNLNSGAENNLNKLIAVLGKYPDTNIEIQGHTDNTGEDAYNLKLSRQRASTVSRFIQNGGVKNSRINVKGFGESAPNYSNDTEDSRAQNRRVEFLISANAKMRNEAEKAATK